MRVVKSVRVTIKLLVVTTQEWSKTYVHSNQSRRADRGIGLVNGGLWQFHGCISKRSLAEDSKCVRRLNRGCSRPLTLLSQDEGKC